MHCVRTLTVLAIFWGLRYLALMGVIETLKFLNYFILIMPFIDKNV